MGYTMKAEGLEDISKMLEQLGEAAPAAASMGLYEGAGEMAQAIKTEAQTIKADFFHYAVWITRLPSLEEKAAVTAAAGSGIAKFDKNGTEVNAAGGFGKAGYVEINGKLKPIAQIANAINSGTSFMNKQPFFRRAVNHGSRKAEDKIVKSIEETMDALIKQEGKA